MPDLVSIHGTLQPSSYITEGATLQVSFRSGPPFPGTTPLIWTITGEKGEIRIASEQGSFIQSEASALPMPIEVHDYATGEVKEAEWKWEEWQEPLLARGKNIGKVYDLFYEGRLAEYGAADIESAVVRHAQLDRMLWP